MRNANRILFGTHVAKMPLTRHGNRWKNNIKMDIKYGVNEDMAHRFPKTSTSSCEQRNELWLSDCVWLCDY